MFAIVSIAGFQEKVQEGDVITVPSLDSEKGKSVSFDKVLMVGDGSDIKLGAPFLSGASVSAEIVEHGKADTIRVVKFRRRKRYHRTHGHRTHETTIKITKISA